MLELILLRQFLFYYLSSDFACLEHVNLLFNKNNSFGGYLHCSHSQLILLLELFIEHESICYIDFKLVLLTLCRRR